MKNILLQEKDKKLQLELNEDTRVVLIPSGEVTLDIKLSKEGVNAEVLALYSLHNSASVTLQTNSIHTLPNTSCNVVVRAALFDSAKSNYIGKIYIGKDAQSTVSFLEDNVLTIGDKAKNASQPVLEILADDVKASHGATTGRLDEDSIYYLMSRGLTRKEAEELCIEGFFEALLSRIDDENIVELARKELYV